MEDFSNFQKPTKPTGSFMDETEARCRVETEGWKVVENPGRGWRRVVASPLPKRVIEREAVKELMEFRAIQPGVFQVSKVFVDGEGWPLHWTSEALINGSTISPHSAPKGN